MMVRVELRGSTVKEFENGTTAAEVAKSLGGGIYKAACAAKIDERVCDLRTPLTHDCKLEILTFDDEDGKKAFRHTAAHVLAQAVKRLYPNAKFAIGPSIDNGFYYDFDVEKPFSPEDIAKIEAEMKNIVKSGIELYSVASGLYWDNWLTSDDKAEREKYREDNFCPVHSYEGTRWIPNTTRPGVTLEEQIRLTNECYEYNIPYYSTQPIKH